VTIPQDVLPEKKHVKNSSVVLFYAARDAAEVKKDNLPIALALLQFLCYYEAQIILRGCEP
jgi:hypothetical protein